LETDEAIVVECVLGEAAAAAVELLVSKGGGQE
jgi:hypothetical protein